MTITARRMTQDEEGQINRMAELAWKTTNEYIDPCTEKERARWTAMYHELMNKATIAAGLRVALK